MKAFVTGATGFVGSHIADVLLQKGWEVDALVRSPGRRSWLDRLPAVRRIVGSLEDHDVLNRAAADADYIFHAAGLVKARSEREYLRANAEGTAAVLEAARGARGRIRRFVYISSQAAAGPSLNGRPVTEEDPPLPITPYGRSKLAGEREVLARRGEVPATIIRPPAVYGPRDREILIYFKLASKGIVPVVGSAARRVALVYVRDLARGTIEAALSAKAAGETYFLTSGEHDWNELSRAVAAAVGRGRRIMVPPAVLWAVSWMAEGAGRLARRAVTLDHHKAREVLQPAWCCSHARAREHFGYEPQWSLETGMAETAAWYRKEGWIR